jgi:hypothetical protein
LEWQEKNAALGAAFFCESSFWPEHAFGILIAVKDLHCLPPFVLQSTIIASTPFATAA